VVFAKVRFDVSERRACRALCVPRSSCRYHSVADRQEPLRMRLRDLAQARVTWGYRRLHVLLRREGWGVNHKRVYRLYAAEGLSMRTKRPRRRRTAATRAPRPASQVRDESWSMDFVSDELFDGRRFRLLTIVDHFTRESVAIELGQHLGGNDVSAILERLRRAGRRAGRIQVDNGPEFTSRALDHWAYEHKVVLDFSRPGKPTDNAVIESFNARLRQECLNTNWFASLDEARRQVELWRQDYNELRPHSALGNLAPRAFAAAGRAMARPAEETRKLAL
jgi:putative transposase